MQIVRGDPGPGRRPDKGKPLRLGEAQGPQEHGIDEGEDRRRPADGEREGRHDHRGETRGAPQQAQGVAHVLPQVNPRRPDAFLSSMPCELTKWAVILPGLVRVRWPHRAPELVRKSRQ